MKVEELVLAKCIRNIDPWGDKENKEITISSETMNYVFDYVDNLQSKIDKAIEYIETMYIPLEYNSQKDELISILKEDK